jgi:transposase
MKTIGVDLHKDSLTVAVLDETGQVERREKIATKCRGRLVEFFASYGPRCQVAVESVGFYAWFWDLAQPLVGRMVLANAPAVKKLRPHRDAKTDPRDAAFLARLLHEGRLPTAFSPPPEMRQLRTLVRMRCHVGRSLADARVLLRWVSLQTNLPGPTTLTSDRAQKWILANEAKLSPAQRTYARKNLDQILLLERQEADLDREIDSFLAAQPLLHHQAELLQTIRGIGPLAAATILAETGGTERFPDSATISSFAGLVPTVRQSADTVHHGALTKAGSPLLRWVLQQAAWVAYRCDPDARRIIARIARNAGLQKAVTAYARKLLTYARSVLHRDQPFVRPQSTSVRPLNPCKQGAWCYSI